MTQADHVLYDLLETAEESGYHCPTRSEGVTRKTIAFPYPCNFIFSQSVKDIPMVTLKHVSFKNVVTELLWFLKGVPSINYLIENNNHIWSSDCFRYQYDKAIETNDRFFLDIFTPKRLMIAKDEFRTKGYVSQVNRIIQEFEALCLDMPYYSTVGNSYPIFWHKFAKELTFDSLQVGNSRLVMSSWQDSSVKDSSLPPCHYSMQIIVHPDNKFSLAWNQRSVDLVLGLPYNIASYAIFMRMIEKVFRLAPQRLIANLGDTHYYSTHDNAVYEIFDRFSNELPKDEQSEPTLEIKTIKKLWEYEFEDFVLHDYKSLGKLNSPTPMMGGII